jgi:general secretion pathway protein D
MTVIPHGRFLKIIESPGVVQDTTEIYGTASPVPERGSLRHAPLPARAHRRDEASNVLSKFKTKEGDITVYPASNLLIITETGTNIQRMLRIIEEIDVGSAGEQIYVEPLNYTSAAEMATKLNDLLDLKKGGSGAAARARGRGGGGGGGRRRRAHRRRREGQRPDHHRHRSRLSAAPRADQPHRREADGRGRDPRLAAAIRGLQGPLADAQPDPRDERRGRHGRPAARPAHGQATGRTGARTPGVAGAGVDEVFEGRIRVTCDEATNTLVTTSSVRDYAQLRNVIDKLDHPRRQVFIEAVIMDVSVDRSTDVGLGYHGGAPFTT